MLASDKCLAGKENIGYRLLKLQKIESVLNEMCLCQTCNSPVKLVETFGNRKGLVSRISMECSNAVCKKSVLLSDPSSEADILINDAVILGTSGHGAMELFGNVATPHSKNVDKA